MVETIELTEELYEIRGEASVYVFKDKKIIIGTGFPFERDGIKKAVQKLIDPAEIKTVIFTHLHMDHCGNFSLFKNAKLYASKKEIEDFNNDPFGTVLDRQTAKDLKTANLSPIEEAGLGDFEVIETPGHTRGSISLLYKKKILFSGDTLFRHGYVGRTDLPTSVPGKLEESVKKLKQLKFEIFCPGHNY
ncbi:MBL fold metallo-hydrolase [Candidatus Woesearchaeota archaeon]|nr:MBL fold metallo-hydrolase [Candidatus Woesearchaeota archaeon]MBW3017702.1 MBL fold metallo-hydrolase [Candidatus Woesearchaeota archaeon]